MLISIHSCKNNEKPVLLGLKNKSKTESSNFKFMKFKKLWIYVFGQSWEKLNFEITFTCIFLIK